MKSSPSNFHHLVYSNALLGRVRVGVGRFSIGSVPPDLFSRMVRGALAGVFSALKMLGVMTFIAAFLRLGSFLWVH